MQKDCEHGHVDVSIRRADLSNKPSIPFDQGQDLLFMCTLVYMRV